MAKKKTRKKTQVDGAFKPDPEVLEACTRGHERISAIVPTWEKSVGMSPGTIRDILADLMHYCDAEAIDFEYELESARNHFICEQEGRVF